jgi:hypothetical protein
VRTQRIYFALAQTVAGAGDARMSAVADTILDYGIDAGIVEPMGTARKITVEVPLDLLRKAQRSTGAGVTATIRRGLELVAAGQAYEGLRRLRGRVKFSVGWRELREDRK